MADVLQDMRRSLFPRGFADPVGIRYVGGVSRRAARLGAGGSVVSTKKEGRDDMKRSYRLKRREFLAAAAAVGAPYLVPAGVLAAPGKMGANERISIGDLMGSAKVFARMMV